MIDLARLDGDAFETLFRTRIAPLLEGAEHSRLEALARYKKRMWIGMPLVLTIGAGIGVFSGEWIMALIVAGFGAVLGAGIAQTPLNQLGERLKGQTLTALAEAIDARYSGAGTPDGVVARHQRLRLLPSYDRANYEDWFSGERHGCAFDLFEGHLEDEHRDKDGDRSWVTVFRGQIIRIAFPKPFAGVTVVRRDSGVFNGMMAWGTKLERVGFASPEFERKFEVYSNDQVEARYLVHPVFAERLLELEGAYEGRRLRCAFEAGELLIAVETKDQYEFGDMFKPLADPERARRIVGDIAAILRVMDSVLTAEKAPLQGRLS